MPENIDLATVIRGHHQEILERWLRGQDAGRIRQLADTDELRRQSDEILSRIEAAGDADPYGPEFASVREYLAEVSRTRALQGFSPRETAVFVFSLRDAVLPALEEEAKKNAHLLARETTRINKLADGLGLVTFETFIEGREEYIREQQRAILELSTPVVEVWEGILAVPLVGTVDTARTQQMMETMLSQIVDRQASFVIIDITGVPLVDTAVAKHLLQTVQAAKLLGAECIIVGISARIAQTLVHLGVDLTQVVTGTTMSKGLAYALQRTGQWITRIEEA